MPSSAVTVSVAEGYRVSEARFRPVRAVGAVSALMLELVIFVVDSKLEYALEEDISV